MNRSKAEILSIFNEWINAWNKHDLDKVMQLIHDDIIFENWTGAKVSGKKNLRRVWTPWFAHHGDFKFHGEDVFFDEEEQKLVFTWMLQWPSNLALYKGKLEVRRGVDVIYFDGGKIIRKHSYTKTNLSIEGKAISIEK